MDVIRDVLKNSFHELEKYKSVQVDKLIDVDVGALLALDSNPLKPEALKRSTNDYLLKLTRDNVQLLYNQVWDLPTERIEEVIVAKLPPSRFSLPRCKPVPKPRPLTKWEKFAKEKGIVKKKKKKSKLLWDEQLKKWIPLYGFKRASAQMEKDWLLEVPQNADPNEDQFARKIEVKSERVAKNELQRLRNVAKARNVKIPRFGLMSPEVSSAKDLQAAVTVAKSSTASLGKFQDKLPKEKETRGVNAITPGGSRKRKLPPRTGSQEKVENLDLAESVLSKRPKISVGKTVANEQVDKPVGRGSVKKSRASTGGKKKSKNTKNSRKGKGC